MVRIFTKWGYYVGNENGKVNLKANIFDFVLYTAYFVVSIINSFGNDPSWKIFLLNALSLGRLIIKNYIEQKKIVTKSKPTKDYLSSDITKIHGIKISCETMALVLLLIFVIWEKINGGSGAVNLMILIVLLFTWLENTLSAFERLYEAVPQPLLYKNKE